MTVFENNAWNDSQDKWERENAWRNAGSDAYLDALERKWRGNNPDERWNINTGKFEPNVALV